MEKHSLDLSNPLLMTDSIKYDIHALDNYIKPIKKEFASSQSKCYGSDIDQLEDASVHTRLARGYCIKKDETAVGTIGAGNNREDDIPESETARPCTKSKEMKLERETCQTFVRDSYLTHLDVVIKQEPDPENIQYSTAVGATLCSSVEHEAEQNSLVVVKVEHEGVEEESVNNGSTVIQKEVQSNGTGVAEKRTYTCEYCHKSFSKKSSLMSHLSTHTGETPYSCPFCDKKFSIRSNRNVHMLIHTGQRPHECEVCSKSFRQAGQLKQHMRIHKGEKPYSCKICFKSFRNSSALVCHQRTHTGERPYNCDICSRSFTTSTSLKTHQVTHTGDMLYDCPVCGRQFNRRNNLNVHIKRHDKIRSFTCPVCNNGFVMRAHLLKHAQRCHKVQLATDDIKTTCLPEENGGIRGVLDIKQENTP